MSYENRVSHSCYSLLAARRSTISLDAQVALALRTENECSSPCLSCKILEDEAIWCCDWNSSSSADLVQCLIRLRCKCQLITVIGINRIAQHVEYSVYFSKSWGWIWHCVFGPYLVYWPPTSHGQWYEVYQRRPEFDQVFAGKFLICSLHIAFYYRICCWTHNLVDVSKTSHLDLIWPRRFLPISWHMKQNDGQRF